MHGKKRLRTSLFLLIINLPPRRTIVLHCGEQGLSNRGGAYQSINALQSIDIDCAAVEGGAVMH
jgi:hypothetical protein